MYLWLFFLELHQKPKSILLKTDISYKFPFFLSFYLVILGAFKTIGILNFDLLNEPNIFTFPSIEIGTIEKNRINCTSSNTVMIETKKKLKIYKKQNLKKKWLGTPFYFKILNTNVFY